MALSTATALLGSAIIGAGSSAISSKNATKAATNASQYATDQSNQIQREALATQQQNTAVARGAGDAAIQQLMQRLGLSTGGQQGANSPLFSQMAQNGQQPNYTALFADRPDVAAAANDPNSGLVGSTPQERAADWYTRYGKAEGYQLPTQALPADQIPRTDVQLSQGAQVPTYTRPDALQAPGTYTPQTYTPQTYNAPTYNAPTYERPEYTDTLDVSYDDYLNSPEALAAQYDTDKQSGATASALAATGGLKSGAALKRLQQIGQDNKVKYYGDFRNYTTNQYNTDRARADALYNFDTQLNAQIKQAYDQLNSSNALAYNQLNSQNAYNYAGLNSQNALNAANFNQNAYQYQQGRADQNFNTDRAYGTDLALANRQYETGRYDNATNALFNLANLGQGAASQYGNALQNSANASTNALFSNAANQGNAALASASMFNNLLGQGLNALGNYYGNQGAKTATTRTGTYGPSV